MGIHQPLTNAQRMARRRAKLRAMGLKPREIWVRDPSDPTFQLRLDETGKRLSGSREMAEIEAFLVANLEDLLEQLD